MRLSIRFAGICTTVGLGALCWASPAPASVTLGQLEAGSPPPANCSNGPVDSLTSAVSSGQSYIVPAGGGVITSWSHNAAAGSGQMFELKLFRNVSGSTFQAVAHDGPRSLTPSALNTFPVRIPVSGGEIVGANDTAAALSSPNACDYHVTSDPANAFFNQLGDLGDGESAAFMGLANDERGNISAVLEADADHDGFGDETQDHCLGVAGPVSGAPADGCPFSFGKVKRNKRKGTATLTVDVPGPGTLVLTGKGLVKQRPGAVSRPVRVAAKTVSAAGKVKLKVRSKGKKRGRLNHTGTVKVKAKVTYTPTGVPPHTQAKKLKLIKR